MGVQTLEDNYKAMALFRQREDKLKQQSTFNIQNTEDDLKILLRILSIKTFPITSTALIHCRDYALYAWSQIYTIQVRTATSSQTLWQPSLQFGRASFNPHLPSGFTFLRTQEYR